MALGDSTRILTNISAFNALSALKSVNRGLERSQLRLATGKRITEVSDDPAGFVISKRLESRNRGLSTALNNVGTAKNILSVAEGGLQNISDLLITIKERTTQAASDALSSAERNAIKNEVNELTEEITDIVEETTFNNRSLISGTFKNISIQTGERPGSTTKINITRSHTPENLGVASSDVADNLLTASGASLAISNVDNAIEEVSDSLQQVGSLISRFEIKENTISVGITNNEATRSRIIDADIALEQLKATQFSILQRTASAALAQANLNPLNILNLFQQQTPRSVLDLFR